MTRVTLPRPTASPPGRLTGLLRDRAGRATVPLREGEADRHERIPQALHHQGLASGGDRSRPRPRAKAAAETKATAPSDRVRFGVIGYKGMGWADMR